MSDAAANLFLVVRYRTGREEQFPLPPGRHRLGSALHAADLVIDDPALAPLHAILEVDGNSVIYIDCSMPIVLGAGHVSSPPEVVLEKGESLVVGNVELAVGRKYRLPDAARLAAPAGSAGLREQGLLGMELGAIGYPTFQRLLASEISAGEAAAAEAQFQQTSVWTLVVVALWLLVMSLKLWLIPAGSGPWPVVHEDMTTALGLMAALFLVSFRGFNYGAQVIFLLAAFTWNTDPPTSDWFTSVATNLLALVVVAPIAYAMGLLIDFGANTEPGRSWPFGRQLALTLAGLMMAARFGVEILGRARGDDDFYFRYFSLAAALICVAWPWVVVPWAAERRAGEAIDVQTVLDAAQLRWVRTWLGQGLALVVGLLPLFMFLCSIGLGERLGESLPPSALVTRAVDQSTVAWYWSTRGRFLTEADLARDETPIVAFRWTDLTAEERSRVEKALFELRFSQSDRDAGSSYETLWRIVGRYRLRTAQEWETLLAQVPSDFQWTTVLAVLYFERNRTRPTYEEPKGLAVYHVAPAQLLPYTPPEPALVRIRMLASYCFLVFAVIGFIILWRRGGESPVGRWMGIALLVTSGSLFAGQSEFFLPSVQYDLWHVAAEGNGNAPLASLAYAWLMLLQLLLSVFRGLMLLNIPWAVLWVHLCWPVSDSKILGTWEEGAWLAGRIAIVTVAYNIVTFTSGMVLGLALGIALGGNFLRDEGQLLLVAQTCGLVSHGIAIGFGWWWRQQTADESEAPYLTWRPVAAGACALVSAALLQAAVELPTSTPWINTCLFAGGAVCLVAFVGFTLAAMLTDNFLRLAAVRDLSAIVVTAFLPFAFEVSDFLVSYLLSDFRTLLHSQQGIEVLTMAIVVLFLLPVYSWLEQRFQAIVASNIEPVECAVAEALDELSAPLPPAARQSRIAALLEELGVEGYVFYGLVGDDEYRRGLYSLTVEPAESLRVSEPLRRFLARRPRFHDLENVPYEWHYFFQQFELYRIQQASGCRFLLPLCLGPSLRGVLLLAESEPAAALARDALVSPLSAAGLEAIRV